MDFGPEQEEDDDAFLEVSSPHDIVFTLTNEQEGQEGERTAEKRNKSLSDKPDGLAGESEWVWSRGMALQGGWGCGQGVGVALLC